MLDASTLKVIQFLQNSFDRSVMPSYVAYLSCTHLVYGGSGGGGGGVVGCKGEGQEASPSVFSALYHGQYVTRWNADTRKPVDSFNSREYASSEDKGQSPTWKPRPIT